ncbi:MAG: hypothetical protein IH986_02840 [Planctomycetes bacterium]|nr:hypothetical protein [Planctomycetota bacterium]
MHRMSIPFLLASIAAGPAIAQLTPRTPPSNARPQATLSGEAKLRYIARQLQLSDEQRADYDQLIELVYRQAMDTAIEYVKAHAEELMDLSQQVRAAVRAGDRAKTLALRQEIMAMSPTVVAEKEFIEAIKQQLLTPEQTKRLDRVRDRLRHNPSGTFAPVDVYQIARDAELTAAQTQKLGKLQAAFPKRFRMESLLNGEKGRRRALNELIQAVRSILTSKQVGEFDRRIAALRPEPATPPQLENAAEDKPADKS